MYHGWNKEIGEDRAYGSRPNRRGKEGDGLICHLHMERQVRKDDLGMN